MSIKRLLSIGLSGLALTGCVAVPIEEIPFLDDEELCAYAGYTRVTKNLHAFIAVQQEIGARVEAGPFDMEECENLQTYD